MALMTEDELTADWRRLKRQKARHTGGVEARVLTNVGFVLGEQYIAHKDGSIFQEQLDENKLYLVFNLIKPRLKRLLGRLTAGSLDFIATPNLQDAQALADKEIIEKLDKALDQKLSQPSVMWQLLWWLAVGGTSFVHTPWIPDAVTEETPVLDEVTGEPLFRFVLQPERIVPRSTVLEAVQSGMPQEMFELVQEVQLTGEVGAEVYGPLNVFIDQGVRSIEDLSPDQMVYIATVRTTGWVERTFGKTIEADEKVEIVSTPFHQMGSAVGGYFLQDLIPLVQGSSDSKPDKDERGGGVVTVIQGYGPASEENPKGRYVCFVPGKGILHDGDNPYGEIPLVDFHWEPVTTTFWTGDYVSDQIAPQRFINKRMSQVGEQANASVYSKHLLGPGLAPADIPADYPGFVSNGLDENGNPRVKRLDGPELPSWFMPATQMVISLFNDVSGAGDLFQESRFPGQLRGSEAIPMLQEILDSEWGPLFEHLGDRMARVKQQRLNRVKQFYSGSRTLHYVDKDMKDEVVEFHKEKVLDRGVNYTVSVERSGLLPELRAVREMRLLNRLNSPLSALYVDRRTGQLDMDKIARELEFGETGRKARIDQYQKLSRQIIDKIWKLDPNIPQPLPFWDHRAMLDELEYTMSTMEYLTASPQVQQLFVRQYEAHRSFLMEEAKQQQQQQASGAIQNAVAMATQQAAAQAAAMAVEQAMGTVQANQQMPTEQLVAQATGAAPQGTPGFMQ